MSPQANPWIGSVVCGRYRIASAFKEGGMAALFLAQDLRTKQTVVLKTPRPTLLTDEFLRRFAREIRALTKLKHPNIVPILDSGEQDGVPFFVLKYMPKGTLRNRQPIDAAGRPRPVTLDSLVLWLGPVAAALDYLHSQNFVHRDVKPDNILFDANDQPYLCDFGILKAAAEGSQDGFATQLTGNGNVIGTPQYMAPEMIAPDLLKGHKADGRSDQYSLGATLYELLAGQPPISDTNVAQVIVKLLQKQSKPLETVAAGLPVALTQAVNRAILLNPSQRYPTCSAFAEAAIAAVRQAQANKRPPQAALVGQAVATPNGIRATCPTCGTAYSLPPSFVGQRWTCSVCQQRFTIQTGSESAKDTGVRAESAKDTRPVQQTTKDPVKKDATKTATARRRSSWLLLIPCAGLLLLTVAALAGGLGWWYLSNQGGPQPAPVGNTNDPKPEPFANPNKDQAAPIDGTDKKDPADKPEVRAEKYRKAAEQGDPIAQTYFGWCCAKGDGVAEDKTEAVRWYRKAADQGYADAQYRLALCYAKGEGIPEDKTEAVKWYRKAADQGNASAQLNLGICYDYGGGVTKDQTEAAKWYRQAADLGNAEAQYALAGKYRYGQGVTQDDAEAVKWYRKSAEQGNAWSMEHLGDMHKNGRGVPRDDAEAVKWYRQAADKGLAWGQIDLASMYRDGRGVAKDEGEAVKWYRKAAEQGNETGQWYLGDMYKDGRGVPKDDVEAVKWYRKSAEQGNERGLIELGDMYRDGRGVGKDKTEASKWYQKAADKGSTSAKDRLKALEK